MTSSDIGGKRRASSAANPPQTITEDTNFVSLKKESTPSDSPPLKSAPRRDSDWRKLRRKKGLSRWSIFNLHYNNRELIAPPGAHAWKDALINEEEEEIRQRKADNERAFNKQIDPYCVIVVGTTGAGKSSVVKLFCGDSVEISSETVSCTKDSTIYSEVGDERNHNRQWMDTQGTDDSDMDDSDEKILKKIFRKLYKQKIHNIIVIWLISGDMDRQKGEYLKQASFINGFQIQSSKTNIWESTLIVQKMGQLQPKMRQIRGVVDACINHGARAIYNTEESIAGHTIGFKCTDFMNLPEDDMYQTLIDSETSAAKMQSLGYVSSVEMQSLIHDKIQSFACFRLSFENKVCDKCGIRGDPRYLYKKCHFNAIPQHPKSLIDYHPQEIEDYHPLHTHLIHDGAIVHIHPGALTSYHPSPLEAIEVEDTENPQYFHTGKYLTTTTGFGCCTSTVSKYECCQNEDQAHKGCEMKYPMKTMYERVGCCQRRQAYLKYNERDGDDEKVEQSSAAFDLGCAKKYDCCQRPELGSDPCVSKYDCCDAIPNSVGCASRYLCCNQLEKEDAASNYDENDDGNQQSGGGDGCQQRYQCCKLPTEARGCQDKYECCEKPPESKGCQTVCDRCGVLWGNHPGCSWPVIDDDNEEEEEEEDMSADEEEEKQEN